MAYLTSELMQLRPNRPKQSLLFLCCSNFESYVLNCQDSKGRSLNPKLLDGGEILPAYVGFYMSAKQTLVSYFQVYLLFQVALVTLIHLITSTM